MVMKVLVIDNFDSFTYNLVDYFEQQKVRCTVVRAKEIYMVKVSDYNGVVISPGPGHPEEHIEMMSFLKAHHNQIPILGICLGMQAIGLIFGSKLKRAAKPMHGKTSDISFVKGDMFNFNSKRLKVMRYHSLVLYDIPDMQFEITAWTQEKEVMAIKHKRFQLWGYQFHPESILTEKGLQILALWILSIKNSTLK